MATIFKGDDTSAFEGHFITINLNNPEGYTISKAIFVYGNKKKTYLNPDFPIVINFDSEETKEFSAVNTCYLVVYDRNGKQKTLKETARFDTKNGVL